MEYKEVSDLVKGAKPGDKIRLTFKVEGEEGEEGFFDEPMLYSLEQFTGQTTPLGQMVVLSDQQRSVIQTAIEAKRWMSDADRTVEVDVTPMFGISIFTFDLYMHLDSLEVIPKTQ